MESCCDARRAFDQRDELEEERKRLADQRREYTKILTEVGRLEYIGERLSQAALAVTDTIGSVYEKNESAYNHGDGEAVLVFADWHYGMTASGAWNEYDTYKCIARVQDVANRAAARIKHNGCRKLHIVVLGDLCHGAVHASARVASEELVADQLMQVSELLAQTIEYLSALVEETLVYVTYGNHMRTVQNKKDSIHRDNMERIIPWWLKHRLASHDDIFVQEESHNELIYFDVCGTGFCATHGDLDSVSKSPLILSTLFQRKYGKQVDCVLLADKHHREEIENLGIQSMICGALCGTDDYANDKRLYSTPEQLLLIVEPGIGIDAMYHLRCTE